MAETASAYDVAASFLRALGAPETPAMKRAVAIWLRFESGGTIVGNNPWNLHSGAVCPKASGFCPGQGTLPGQIGNRYAGPGDQNVAVFATLDDGSRASAQNLIRLAPAYGYGEVIKAARTGNAVGFLSALQQSSWSAGHYDFSKLTSAFGGSFDYNTALTLRSPGGASAPSSLGTASSIGSGTLTGSAGTFADFQARLKEIGISTDPNHKITHDEAVLIVSKLYKMNVAGNEDNDIIKTMIAYWEGKTLTAAWDEGKPQTLGPDPLGAVGDAVGNVMDVGEFLGGIGAFLFDTDNWKYLAALALGIPLSLLGFYLLAGVPTGGANA